MRSLVLAAPAAAHARDVTVTSFDGTQIVDLRGRPTGAVKVKVTVRRNGRTVRETRTYRTCASRSRS